MLHLCLVMLPPEPVIGLPVHPLGFLWELLHHVRAPSESLPYLLRPHESPVHFLVPLALVAEVVAMPAQEVAPRPVQDRNPPTAARSGADEPGPLSSEVARRPTQGYGLPYVFPFSGWTAPVTVEKYHLLWPCVSHYCATDRARLMPGPRPAQRE